MIDTGADISVISRPKNWHQGPVRFKLYAVNGSSIYVFGVSQREINIGLPHRLRWNFTVADVPHSIIGADLLSHYHLLPDLKLKKLVDEN